MPGIPDYLGPVLSASSATFTGARTGLPRFILDLRKASPDSPVSGWLTKTLNFRSIWALATEEQFHPLNVSEVFDTLIYFEETTATEILRPRER